MMKYSFRKDNWPEGIEQDILISISQPNTAKELYQTELPSTFQDRINNDLTESVFLNYPVWLNYRKLEKLDFYR